MYKGRPVRIRPYLSRETLKARGIWTDVLQTLRSQMPVQNIIASKTFNQLYMEKIRYSMSKSNVNNIYLQMQPYRRCLKEKNQNQGV